jgi:hypothetical protein
MQRCRIRRRPVASALATEAALGDPQNAAFFIGHFLETDSTVSTRATPTTLVEYAVTRLRPPRAQQPSSKPRQARTGCSVSPPPVTRPFIGAQNTLPNQRVTYWCTSRQPQWNSLCSEEIGSRLGASLWTRPRGVRPPPLPQPPHLSPQLDSHL